MPARTRASIPGRSAELREGGAARYAGDRSGGRGPLAGLEPRAPPFDACVLVETATSAAERKGAGQTKTRPRPIKASAGFAIHSTRRMGDPNQTAPGFIVSEVDPR